MSMLHNLFATELVTIEFAEHSDALHFCSPSDGKVLRLVKCSSGLDSSDLSDIVNN